jgi:hypothetical protein
MYSTINVRNGIQATPRGRRLNRTGVGFELATKRLPARRPIGYGFELAIKRFLPARRPIGYGSNWRSNDCQPDGLLVTVRTGDQTIFASPTAYWLRFEVAIKQLPARRPIGYGSRNQ